MNSQLKPQHKVWEPIVEVPTIVVDDLKNRPSQIFFQWFGKADLRPLIQQFGNEVAKVFGQMQFRFPISAPPGDIHWMGHPELFQVIFVDQAKNWPNKNAIASFGNPEKWLLWVTSTHYMVGTGGPACFAVELNMMLADGLYGIIEPRPYCNMEVLEGAERRTAN